MTSTRFEKMANRKRNRREVAVIEEYDMGGASEFFIEWGAFQDEHEGEEYRFGTLAAAQAKLMELGFSPIGGKRQRLASDEIDETAKRYHELKERADDLWEEGLVAEARKATREAARLGRILEDAGYEF